MSFRVDRMTNLSISEADSIPTQDGFNPVLYAQQNFRMYGGEEAQWVTLECKNHLMKCVIDFFGDDVQTSRATGDTFHAKVLVSAVDTFYGWVFQFGGQIKIVSPNEVVEEYHEMARKILNN